MYTYWCRISTPVFFLYDYYNGNLLLIFIQVNIKRCKQMCYNDISSINSEVNI